MSPMTRVMIALPTTPWAALRIAPSIRLVRLSSSAAPLNLVV
jgi:hypothetical protein